MPYKQFQWKCLLNLFKTTQCVTNIGHQPLLCPKHIIHNSNAVSNSYTMIQKEFLGIESRYDLDGRKSNNYMYQYICKYCKVLLTTNQS